MVRLVAGIDISGNQDSGNDRYMGIVIGTDENINSITRDLKMGQFQGREIKHMEYRRELASKLQFNGRENMALCVKIERKKIVDEIINWMQKKRSSVNRTQIVARYNYHLLRHIRERMSTFTTRHHNSLSDVVFECDNDCVDFLKNNGLKCGDEGFAYKLSDIVAWANNREQEPSGVNPIDVTDRIKTALRHDFK